MSQNPSLNVENRFVKLLPGDIEQNNYVRQVNQACYSLVKPTVVQNPELVLWSEQTATILDIELNDSNKSFWLNALSGNETVDGMQSYAMCYGGHQFGNWAGQLGDGRAINLGELVTSHGHYTLQLKGSGMTPYSRHADGLAVLRSSVREFLCSEAMHHLGVPTTRALSLITTGELVQRDMFYDGNPAMEKGAIVCRVAPSFIRFGSFELPSSRRDIETLRELADFCIKHDFAGLERTSDNIYLDWFNEVVKRTIAMAVHWQRVGFVHGVMNTDNMSILGLTIDYGPYGWLEAFDPEWTPNTTDLPGRRYAFGQQTKVSQWNLFKLAEAIFPLVEDSDALQSAINEFPTRFKVAELKMQLAKLGLPYSEAASDLVSDLLAVMKDLELDMTLFYRNLANCESEDEFKNLLEFSYKSDLTEQDKERFLSWVRRYQASIESDVSMTKEARKESMDKVNPWFVLRNFLVQEAIEDAEKDDMAKLVALKEILQNPYEEDKQYASLVKMRPDWALNKAGCSMLSCSS